MTFPAFRPTSARLPDECWAATSSFCPGGHDFLWLVRPPEKDCYYTSVLDCVKRPLALVVPIQAEVDALLFLVLSSEASFKCGQTRLSILS